MASDPVMGPAARRPTVDTLGAARRAFVRRDRVLQVLQQSQDLSVIGLTAPGGYGKTTVLSQWAREDPRPFVWLTVRPQAADAAWVAQSVLRQCHSQDLIGDLPVLPQATDTIGWHLGVLPLVEETLASIADACVVVIDDAGSLSGQRWECLASSVAASLPPGSPFVLATRTSLPRTLTRAQTAGDVRIIGTNVLALDRVEASALLHRLGARLNQEEFGELMQASEGWPVAVYLSALAARSGRPPLSVADHQASEGTLARYLDDEILARLHAEDVTFLRQASVLAELDEPTCDAVSRGSGSLARLRRLADVNHLLQPVDHTAVRYRLHPLLASFLEDQLKAANPSEWRRAHAAASLALEAATDTDGAVFHAKRAPDDARLGTLAWQQLGPLMTRGRVDVVLRWLADVPPARLWAQGRLALTRAWVAATLGDAETLARGLVAARSAATDDDDLATDLQLLEAVAGVGSIVEMETKARAFIDAAAPDDMWLAVGHFLLGVSLQLQRQDVEAQDSVRQAHLLAVAHDAPAMQARCLTAQANAALASGAEDRALPLIRQSRSLVQRHHLDHMTTLAPVLTASALGYILEGHVAQARQEAQAALRATSRMRIIAAWNLVHGLLALADVFLRLGDRQQAAGLLREAEQSYSGECASPVGDLTLRRIRERVERAGGAGANPDALSTAELRVLQYLPTHLTFSQMADELFVSTHTVKTQASAIYRKLNVHSRSAAIEQARLAGLLPAKGDTSHI